VAVAVTVVVDAGSVSVKTNGAGVTVVVDGPSVPATSSVFVVPRLKKRPSRARLGAASRFETGFFGQV
jgi:hypothetical protein